MLPLDCDEESILRKESFAVLTDKEIFRTITCKKTTLLIELVLFTFGKR